MLHTLRQILNDDVKWRDILRGLNADFYHQVVTGAQVEEYIITKTGLDLKSFFDQYLRDVRIPVFEYFVKENEISFRWNNCVPRFNMPLKIWVSGKPLMVTPSTGWTKVKTETPNPVVEADKDYYVASLNMMGK